MPPDKREPIDFVSRGQYGSSPLGTSLFLGIQFIDGFIIQRALQVLDPVPALFAKLGLSVPPPPPRGGSTLAMSAHDLTPFQAVIWSMAIASVLKHTYYTLYVSREKVAPSSGLAIAVINLVWSSVGTVLFRLARANPTWSPTVLYASVPVFAAGMFLETVSETQRKWFKDDPRNAGKPYAGGLFGYARSINYFGFTLWRGAQAAAGGGWAFGLATSAFFAWDFVSRAIPIMDRYCAGRYGAGQWAAVKRKVPYAFVPGIY